MRKDFKEQISLKEFDNILGQACNFELDFDVYEGSLLDNATITNDEVKKIGRKTRKYLIMVEKYLNCWTSTIELIGTDNEQTYDKWVNRFGNSI